MEDIKEAEERSYTVIHVNHGKEVIKATSSYGAAKKYADMKKLKSTAGVDAHLMEAIPKSTMYGLVIDNEYVAKGSKESMRRMQKEKGGTVYNAPGKKVGDKAGTVKEETETKYAIISYPDTAISYIENDGNGWTHIYDKSYGFEGPVDKADLKHAKKIAKEKIPSRMMDEGYYEMPSIDRERYTEMPGLEGPFQTRSGKVVYYDPKEGAYYDRDTDMYMTYDEFKSYDNVDTMRKQAESVIDTLKKQLEGKSPHKKGTKKYKAHMAAMHANSAEPQGQMIETKEEKLKTVTLEDMRSVLELDKDTTSLDIVSNYVKTTLDETFDTWPKVRQQVDYILSRVSDTNAVSSDEVFDKVFKENLQSQLDEQVMVSENIDTLRDIVNNKSVMTVKFQDGSMKVDMTTANIFLQAYDKMKESNQEKISEMMKTKKGFLRVLDFIYGAMK